mmetsp:Transcript_12238/g.49135  ORF Transcript_12238/g.49135 Transcript_12238/m.49135 type:complete len:208 (+) Transcript_12238:108-731(+)
MGDFDCLPWCFCRTLFLGDRAQESIRDVLDLLSASVQRATSHLSGLYESKLIVSKEDCWLHVQMVSPDPSLLDRLVVDCMLNSFNSFVITYTMGSEASFNRAVWLIERLAIVTVDERESSSVPPSCILLAFTAGDGAANADMQIQRAKDELEKSGASYAVMKWDSKNRRVSHAERLVTCLVDLQSEEGTHAAALFSKPSRASSCSIC